MIALVVGLGLFVAGCTTKPSYAGKWKGQMDGETVLLDISEEDGFVISEQGMTYVGRWKTTDNGQAEFVAVGEDEKGVGSLLNDNELFL